MGALMDPDKLERLATLLDGFDDDAAAEAREMAETARQGQGGKMNDMAKLAREWEVFELGTLPVPKSLSYGDLAGEIERLEAENAKLRDKLTIAEDRAKRAETAMQAMLDAARETMPDDLPRLREWAHGIYAQWKRAEAENIKLRGLARVLLKGDY